MTWLLIIAALIAFWPATCEAARLSRRTRTRHNARTTNTRKEKP